MPRINSISFLNHSPVYKTQNTNYTYKQNKYFTASLNTPSDSVVFTGTKHANESKIPGFTRNGKIKNAIRQNFEVVLQDTAKENADLLKKIVVINPGLEFINDAKGTSVAEYSPLENVINVNLANLPEYYVVMDNRQHLMNQNAKTRFFKEKNLKMSDFVDASDLDEMETIKAIENNDKCFIKLTPKEVAQIAKPVLYHEMRHCIQLHASLNTKDANYKNKIVDDYIKRGIICEADLSLFFLEHYANKLAKPVLDKNYEWYLGGRELNKPLKIIDFINEKSVSDSQGNAADTNVSELDAYIAQLVYTRKLTENPENGRTIIFLDAFSKSYGNVIKPLIEDNRDFLKKVF